SVSRRGGEEREYEGGLAAGTIDPAPCNACGEELAREAVRLSWRPDRADRVQAALQADWIARGPADEARRRRDEVADLARRLWPDSPPPDPAVHADGRTDEILQIAPAGPAEPDHPARLGHPLE